MRGIEASAKANAPTDALRWLPAAMLIVALLIHLPTLGAPLVDRHPFRQTQTAFTARIFHEDGIDLLHPKLPILGAPWEVPFEFPAYQAVAAVVMDVGVPEDTALRLTGLASFLLAAGLLWLLVRRQAGWLGATVALAIFLFSPLGISWGRASLIEYSALAASFGFALSGLRWRDSALGRVVRARARPRLSRDDGQDHDGPVLGRAVRAVRGVPRRRRRRTRRSWAGRVGPVDPADPGRLRLDALRRCHQGRVRTPTAWLTSSAAPRPGTRGPWRSASSSARGRRSSPSAILLAGGIAIPFLAYPAIRFAVANRQLRFWAWIAVTAPGPILVFFNLYYVHDYYAIAVSPSIAALVGLGVAGLPLVRTWLRGLLLAGAALAWAAVWFVQMPYWTPDVRRDVGPRGRPAARGADRTRDDARISSWRSSGATGRRRSSTTPIAGAGCSTATTPADVTVESLVDAGIRRLPVPVGGLRRPLHARRIACAWSTGARRDHRAGDRPHRAARVEAMTQPPADLDLVVLGGGGHVGLPLSLAFAQAGLRVGIYDTNPATLERIAAGEMPFMENGADELLREILPTGRLSFGSDGEMIARAETLVVVIGTPVDEFLGPSMTIFEKAVEQIAPYLRDGALVVLRSTVYPGHDRLCRPAAGRARLPASTSRSARSGSPRATRSRSCTRCRRSSARTRDVAAERATALFSTLASKTVRTTTKEAELAKLFTNTWRYMKFAVANQFFMIADQAGVDYTNVLRAIREDYPRALDLPGPGFAAGPVPVQGHDAAGGVHRRTTSRSARPRCRSTRACRPTSSPPSNGATAGSRARPSASSGWPSSPSRTTLARPSATSFASCSPGPARACSPRTRTSATNASSRWTRCSPTATSSSWAHRTRPYRGPGRGRQGRRGRLGRDWVGASGSDARRRSGSGSAGDVPATVERRSLPVVFIVVSSRFVLEAAVDFRSVGSHASIYTAAAAAWLAGGDPWTRRAAGGDVRRAHRRCCFPSSLRRPAQDLTRLIWVVGSAALAVWTIRHSACRRTGSPSRPSSSAIELGHPEILVLWLLVLGGTAQRFCGRDQGLRRARPPGGARAGRRSCSRPWSSW